MDVEWVFEKDALLDHVLLSPSVELFDGTQLIEKLLIDQPWHLQKLVVGDKLIQDLALHPPGLQDRSGERTRKCQNAEEKDKSNFSYDTENRCSWFYCFNAGPT